MPYPNTENASERSEKLVILAGMTARERQVYLLHGQGCAQEEISGRLGTSQQYVSQTLARALDKLARAYERRAPGESFHAVSLSAEWQGYAPLSRRCDRAGLTAAEARLTLWRVRLLQEEIPDDAIPARLADLLRLCPYQVRALLESGERQLLTAYGGDYARWRREAADTLACLAGTSDPDSGAPLAPLGHRAPASGQGSLRPRLVTPDDLSEPRWLLWLNEAQNA